MTDILQQLIDNYEISSSDNFGSPGTSRGLSPSELFESPGVVDDVSEFSGDGSIQIGHLSRLGGIDSITPDLCERVEFEPTGNLGAIVQRMHRSFKGSDKRYVSDIFRCENSIQANSISRLIRDDALRTNGRRFLIVRQHGSHIHVVHLCTYSGGYCRCTFTEKAKARANIGKPHGGFRRKYASRISPQDCTSILLYFIPQLGDKGFTFFIIGGRVERELCGSKILQEQRHLPDTYGAEKYPMEACSQNHQIELLSPEQIRNNIEQVRVSRVQRGLNVKAGGKKNFQEHILKMVKKYCVCPIRSIFNHVKWLQDPELMFVREDNKLACNVIDTFSELICNWSLLDFYCMYIEVDAHPCFNATNNLPLEYYYDYEESITILKELLHFQFRNDELAIRNFLTNLYNIVERKAGKCNTLLINAPPSAGKNFFMDTIICFVLNKGQLGNPNKHNNFAYQEAKGKRILLWNEPNYEPSETDKLKMILGGDNYTVNVKCKADCAVQKTPVIILTNTVVPFMVEDAFKDRIVQYNWRTAPFLKEYNKKPHPVSIYLLFKDYNIC